MRPSPLVVSVSALLLACCSRPHTLASFEGTITMHTSSPGAEPHDLVVKAKGTKLRLEMTAPGGGSNHAIYDPATNRVTLFFDGPKQYSDLDFSSPSAPAPNTDAKSASIVKAGREKVVAGYACEEWAVKDAAGHTSDVCLAEGVAFVDLNRLRAGGGAAETPLARQFREHKAFPLQAVERDADGKELSRMEVTRIERGALDDGEFGVPAGYTRIDRPLRAR